jgi:hypothetical protein
MRNTTLLLALAALAATSCSLQLDSQYGLRWDRSVPAMRHSENRSQEPLTDPDRYVEPVQIDASTSEFVPTSNNEPNEIALYDHMVEDVREEQLPYSNIANQNHRTYSVGTVTVETEVQQASTPSETTQADPFIILLKALLTLVLGVLVLFYLAFAVLIAITGGGGGGGLWGAGLDPMQIFIFFLFTGLGTFGYIKLMKKFWKKSSKS